MFSRANYLTDLFTLPTLKQLRVLKAYHGSQVHRLDVLAANPTFAHLTHLFLHPHALAWHDNRTEDETAGFRKRGRLPSASGRRGAGPLAPSAAPDAPATSLSAAWATTAAGPSSSAAS